MTGSPSISIGANLLRKLLSVVLLCSVVSTALSQERALKGALAIVGARIEPGNGRIIEKGNVMVRDGIIEAVGADVKVPPDAEIIKGDGLVVYPGFTDAFLTRGLKLPDPQPDQDSKPDESIEAPPFMREANRKGVRAEIRASDWLALTEPELTALRKAGFTTAVVAPTGGYINGTAALVNLSGLPRRESVLLDNAGMCFSLRTSGFGFGGGYPNSLMGIMAHVRQSLLDAAHWNNMNAFYNSGSYRRAPSDATLTALFTATNSQWISIMEADTDLEIGRSLAFAKEFGMVPVLCGGLEASKRAEELVKQKVGVIAGLNFGPDPSKATGEEDTPTAVREDRKRLWNEKVGNLKRLSEQSVFIALSDRGLQKPDEFWENLRLAIKAGFPRDAALRALTTNPAFMFLQGSHLGTIEPGRIGNLTIMSGDFADEKTKTRYVIIDGKKFEADSTPAGPPTPGGRRGRPTEDDELGGQGK
jgi:imidazolonepropionase-like amidohydrolase